jgi:hypothetical protein
MFGWVPRVGHDGGLYIYCRSQKIDQRNNQKKQYSWCGGQRKSQEATTEQYLAHVTDE